MVADQLHNGSRHLTLRSGDGPSFLVPAWMIDPAAASISIIDVPRLSLACLVELRAFLDLGLASAVGTISPREAPMAKHGTSTQTDLFETRSGDMALAPAERTKALQQLQTLLTEAMATWGVRPEAGDDQDHG